MEKETKTFVGSPLECGYQLGNAYIKSFYAYRKDIENCFSNGRTWDDYRTIAEPYITATQKAYPFIIDELMGISKSTGIDFSDLFIMGAEEFFESPYDHCTDIIAMPSVTKNKELLLGHNNDLELFWDEHTFVCKFEYTDDNPWVVMLGGCGYYICVGYNHDLLISGNELKQNDSKIGIPRAYIARAIIAQRNINDGIACAIDKNRASSYNNIIIDREGTIANVEASGTEFRIIPPTNGILTHANNYVHPELMKYDNHNSDYSSHRLNHSRELLELNKGNIDEQTMMSILGNHDPSYSENENKYGPLCKHGQNDTHTTFGFTANISRWEFKFSPGKPCQEPFILLPSL